MNDILYDANPSLVRMYPITTVISVILIPVGVGILMLLWMYLKAKMDRLTIKTTEIVHAHGLISKSYTEVAMSSVRTVKVSQTLVQRMLNAGDIAVYTAGDNPEFVVKGLPDPNEIREMIKGHSVAGEMA